MLYWVTSYVKSGNTWARAIIASMQLLAANHQHKEELRRQIEVAPWIDLNNIGDGTIASSRGWLETIAGVPFSFLSEDQAYGLRAHAYQYYANNLKRPIAHKMHDSLYPPNSSQPVILPSNTQKIIYVVRNPLSLAASLSHYGNTSIDRAIELMSCENYNVSSTDNKREGQVRQWYKTWSQHVNEWTSAEQLSVLVVKYEDLQGSTLDSLRELSAFLGLQLEDDDLLLVSKACNFSLFKEFERKHKNRDMREINSANKQFYRRGKVDSWKQELTAKQIKKIMSTHGTMMDEMGYGTLNDRDIGSAV